MLTTAWTTTTAPSTRKMFTTLNNRLYSLYDHFSPLYPSFVISFMLDPLNEPKSVVKLMFCSRVFLKYAPYYKVTLITDIFMCLGSRYVQ